MKQYQIPEAPHCPSCSALLDGATDADDVEGCPHPGALTLCCYCGAVLTFADDMTLRVFGEAEIATLDSDTQKKLRRAVAIVQQISPRTPPRVS